jgi:hypothetical protein
MMLDRSRNQQGFALPIAMGMGIVLLLIGISTVVRSQADGTAATTQKTTARGLSAAETGIGRIQETINIARPIALYPACISWSTTDNSCADTASSAASWKNPATILNVSTGCPGSLSTTEIAAIASRDWKDVDSADASKGQYRLVNYTYATATSTGTLTVEGRVNQNGTGSTATSELNTSISRLQVNIPVVKASNGASMPALWIGSATGTNMQSDRVKGNIVVNACALSGTLPTPANLSDTTAYSVKAIRRNLPGTPSLPSTYTDLTTGTVTPWTTTLPRSTDLPYTDSKGTARYAYLVKNLDNPTGSSQINLTNTSVKVDLFVQGDINLSGNPDINPSGSSSQLRIFGNESTGGSSYKYGCASGVTCPTSTVHFEGTGTINAFVYAPAGVGSVNGGGSTNGNFKGALWLKDWNASSGNDNVKVDSVGNYGDFGWDNPLDQVTLSPLTAWDRQQVN